MFPVLPRSGTKSRYYCCMSLLYEHSAISVRPSLGGLCSAGVSLAHPRYVPAGFPSGPSLPHLCTRIVSGTSLNTTFLYFSRSIWSTPVFPAANQLEGLYAFSGMNPISVRTWKILQHIGASQEILKMIQSFLLQQKLTQKSLGRLAQLWLAHAKALWAILARLRRRCSCLLPHLALPCLAFSSCLHCTFCVRTLRSAFMAVECYSYTLHEASDKHHLCVSVTCCVLGKALYILYSEGCQNLIFSILPKASAGLKGWRDLPRVTQLVSAEAGSWRVHLSSKPQIHLLHPMTWPLCHIQHHAHLLPFRRCFLIHEMLFEWLTSGLIIFLRWSYSDLPYCPKQSIFIQDILYRVLKSLLRWSSYLVKHNLNGNTLYMELYWVYI